MYDYSINAKSVTRPWGGFYMKKVRDACQKIPIKSLKETNVTVAQALSHHFKDMTQNKTEEGHARRPDTRERQSLLRGRA